MGVSGGSLLSLALTSRLARFLPRSLGVGTVDVVLAGVLTFESDGVGGTPGVWAGVWITGVSEVGIIPSEVSHSTDR